MLLNKKRLLDFPSVNKGWLDARRMMPGDYTRLDIWTLTGDWEGLLYGEGTASSQLISFPPKG
jgi:hypothetical protein